MMNLFVFVHNVRVTKIGVLTLLSICFINCISAQEAEGWKSLFNEENLAGWTTKIHHYETGDNYGDTFRVEDSIIKVRYDKYEGDFNGRFAHLYYDTPYSYFHLSMEYRFVGESHPGAPDYVVQNSGVMFHSQDP